MIIKIVGYDNKTTVNEETGEVKTAVQIYYTKNNKDENGVGEVTGSEYVTGKNFPEQVAEILKSKETIIGRKASISKDVRTFKGTSYTVLDEFELLK